MNNKDIDYGAVLEDLRSQRDRLNNAIAAIEWIVRGRDGNGISPPGLASTGEPEESEDDDDVRPGSYRDMTIGDAAVHFLRTQGRPQKLTYIVSALKAGGIRSESKNLYTTAYNTLTARAKRPNTDVVKVGTRWGLKEWNDSRQ
jgi:hypothetical protein